MVTSPTKAVILGVGMIAILVILILIGIKLGKGDNTKLPPLPQPLPYQTSSDEMRPATVYADMMFKDTEFLANLFNLYKQYPPHPVSYTCLRPETAMPPLSLEDVTKLIEKFIAEHADLDKAVFDLDVYKDRLVAAFMFFLRGNKKAEMPDEEVWSHVSSEKPITAYLCMQKKIFVDDMEANRLPTPEFLTLFPNIQDLIIRRCNITDWSGVSDFKWIVRLKIESCNLPEDLPSLVNLFGLHILSLVNCTGLKNISFEGCLKDKPQNLDVLYLQGTKSIKSIKGLFEMAPEIDEIVFDKSYENDPRILDWISGYNVNLISITYKDWTPPKKKSQGGDE